MADRLEMLYEEGAKLFVSGRPATPEMVIKHVAGNVRNCMPQFFYNEEGRLAEIRF